MKKVILLFLSFSLFYFNTSKTLAYLETFDDSSYLTDPRWTIEANEGSIASADGFLHIESDNPRQFPYIIIDLSDLFSSNNHFLEVGFRFLNQGVSQGSGIVFSDRFLPNGTMDSNDYKGVWLWPSAVSNIYVVSNLCGGNLVCPYTIHETISNDYPSVHTLRINRLFDSYQILIDGVRQYDLASTREFKYLWLGNPELTNSNQIWPSLDVDYLGVNETPSVLPTPTPSPTPSGFDLPFSYPNRPNATQEQFRTAFWGRLTAAFDHMFRPGMFRPFTGDTYSSRDCPFGVLGITCYDSHNGTDFSRVGGEDVLSVDSGQVVFASEHSDTLCVPNKGGFGCVVIVSYPNGTYALYAHLDKIFVNIGQIVTRETVIGEMGSTGCPGCGEHLHLGVMKPVGSVSALKAKKMTKNDWKDIVYQAKPVSTPKYHPACTYKAPNGTIFSFQDPSGWKGEDIDPWSLSRDNGGCGVVSPGLWRFDVDDAGLEPVTSAM